MATKPSKPVGPVYQLKITLKGSHPPIWRRLLVPSGFSLNKLHNVIQLAMGWTDSHLHHFIVDGEYYSVPSPDDFEPVADERNLTLGQAAPFEKHRFEYEYDFGDSWTHVIVVEKIQSPEPNVAYPCCVKGKRACPPEDVGGVYGYKTFLEAILDPKHEEHESFMEWIGGDFDPEEFDIDSVNGALMRVK